MFSPHKTILSLTALSALSFPGRGGTTEPQAERRQTSQNFSSIIKDLDANFYDVRENASSKLSSYRELDKSEAELFLKTYLRGSLEQQWRLEEVLEERSFEELAGSLRQLTNDRTEYEKFGAEEYHKLGKLFLSYTQHELEKIASEGSACSLLLDLAVTSPGQQTPTQTIHQNLRYCRSIDDIKTAEAALESIKSMSQEFGQVLERMVLLRLVNKYSENSYVIEKESRPYLVALASCLLNADQDGEDSLKRLLTAIEDFARLEEMPLSSETYASQPVLARIKTAGTIYNELLYFNNLGSDLRKEIAEISGQDPALLRNDLMEAAALQDSRSILLIQRRIGCLRKLEEFLVCGSPKLQPSQALSVLYGGIRDACANGDADRCSRLFKYLECNSKFSGKTDFNDPELSHLALNGVKFSNQKELLSPHRHNLILYAVYSRLAASQICPGNEFFPRELYELQKAKSAEDLMLSSQPELDLLKWYGQTINDLEDCFIKLDSPAGRRMLGLSYQSLIDDNKDRQKQITAFIKNLPYEHRRLLEDHRGAELREKYEAVVQGFEFITGPELAAPANQATELPPR